MNRLSTLFTAVLMLGFLGTAQAQLVGPTLGVNLSSIKSTDDNNNLLEGEEINYKARVGYHIGITYEQFLGKETPVSITASLLYQTAGQDADQIRINSDSSNRALERSNTTVLLNYLTLPIDFKAWVKLSDDIYLYGKAGPYLGYLFSGKQTIEFDANSTKNRDAAIEFGTGDGQFNRLDYGAGFGGGIGFWGVQLGADYNIGFGSVQNINSNDPVDIQNRFTRISLSYLFGHENRPVND